MSIKLAIAGRPPIELHNDHITLGSDPNCSVSLPDIPEVKPHHAVIRLIDGRYVIEVRDAEAFFVRGTESKKAHWLNSGDMIRLSENGPAVTFELAEEKASAPAPSPAPAPKPAAKSATRESDVEFLLESDSEILRLKLDAATTAPVPKPPSSSIIQVPKPAATAKTPPPKAPSSVTIPTTKSPLSPTGSKAPSSTTIRVPQSPSSSTIPTPKPPSSTTIRSTKAPSSTTIRVPKAPSSSTIPTSKPPSSTTIRSTKSPSSTTIRSTKPPSGDSIVSGKGGSKSSISNSNIPTKGSKRPPSSSQIPVHEPDEPSAGLPMLKRLSSYEMPVSAPDQEESWDESLGNRKSSKGDADIQWIKMIVGRSVGAGLVVLILWIAIIELWKSFSSPRNNVSSASTVWLDRSVLPSNSSEDFTAG